MVSKNKENRKESNKKWYQENKESLQKIHKLYRAKAKYNIYRNNAKQRGHSFNITKDEFNNLLTQNCHYCNSKDNIGVDRIDSLIGYVIENCVSCCNICNRMKGTYSIKDFLKQCNLISKNKSS